MTQNRRLFATAALLLLLLSTSSLAVRLSLDPHIPIGPEMRRAFDAVKAAIKGDSRLSQRLDSDAVFRAGTDGQGLILMAIQSRFDPQKRIGASSRQMYTASGILSFGIIDPEVTAAEMYRLALIKEVGRGSNAFQRLEWLSQNFNAGVAFVNPKCPGTTVLFMLEPSPSTPAFSVESVSVFTRGAPEVELRGVDPSNGVMFLAPKGMRSPAEKGFACVFGF